MSKKIEIEEEKKKDKKKAKNENVSEAKEEVKAEEAKEEKEEKAEEQPQETKEETKEDVSEEEDAEAAEKSEKDAGKPDKKEKKGLFSKKKDPKQEKIEELEDRVKRQMAEFENFRKRTEKEKTEMFSMGARSVIEKILPTVDNFERGLAGANEEDAFVQGMDKVYKKLMTDLDELGVLPIEAVGKEFDPEFHNAVMQDAEGDADPGTITKELQKGYTFKGHVVRHSMVAVKS